MNHYYKLLSVLLVIAVLLVTGCSEQAQTQKDDGNITVAVSILPQAEFVEQIGGEKVNTIVMIPPGANPATHEPTSGQLRDLSNALMYAKLGSGLPFENSWMDKIRSVNDEMLIVNSSNGITIRNNDPHVWTSPENAKIMVENIYKGLIQVDPENKDYYSQNKDRYMQELDELDSYINNTLSEYENQSFIVYHPTWGYFAQEYGLDMIPVESEGKEPSAKELQQFIDIAKEKNISVIYVQEQFSTSSAESIANEVNGKVVTLDPLSKDYVSNLRNVSEVLAENFNQ
ncbi:metal ABC transporter solute-binding protein, Zn/Mn family [Methanohalobium sp.]|uniref:metal ABC transporter solute-binding protein, Zn/Mn family n=1 Tax=Methanohalobium sp. TaxID=2837493 RepID=UPI0025F0FB3E|nr:zinc ABC transporter substrate-binding protein [Methanohalobium sp.]